MEVLSAKSVKSGNSRGRKITCNSSGVSCTVGGFSWAGSGPITGSSSSAGFISWSGASSPAAARRSSSAFLSASLRAFFAARSPSFAAFSAWYLRISSACFTLNSASAFSCFSFSMSSGVRFLKSAVGSPISTWAVFLKCGKRARSSFLSERVRLDFTSTTRKFLRWTGAMLLSTRRTCMVSSSGTPMDMSGLSLQVLHR
mmetsp:Transcript_82655/g.198363  ORF Transcript_82655/g.198363 Transcript_82655/m.198363 type:complete len:200 (+) Transcript_82655:1078-1677(+)